MDELLATDTQILIWINRTMANGFFDAIMPVLRKAEIWIPLYLVFAGLSIYWFRKNSWIILLFAAITVTASDRISSGLMKPYFERPRPCHQEGVEEQIILRKADGCGGPYGFVSSHASNHFAIAFFLIIVWKRKIRGWLKLLLLLWAASISYAQVYVGVHYPGDVLFGAMLGALLAVIFGVISVNILKPFYRPRPHEF